MAFYFVMLLPNYLGNLIFNGSRLILNLVCDVKAKRQDKLYIRIEIPCLWFAFIL